MDYWQESSSCKAAQGSRMTQNRHHSQHHRHPKCPKRINPQSCSSLQQASTRAFIKMTDQDSASPGSETAQSEEQPQEAARHPNNNSGSNNCHPGLTAGPYPAAASRLMPGSPPVVAGLGSPGLYQRLNMNALPHPVAAAVVANSALAQQQATNQRIAMQQMGVASGGPPPFPIASMGAPPPLQVNDAPSNKTTQQRAVSSGNLLAPPTGTGSSTKPPPAAGATPHMASLPDPRSLPAPKPSNQLHTEKGSSAVDPSTLSTQWTGPSPPTPGRAPSHPISSNPPGDESSQTKIPGASLSPAAAQAAENKEPLVSATPAEEVSQPSVPTGQTDTSAGSIGVVETATEGDQESPTLPVAPSEAKKPNTQISVSPQEKKLEGLLGTSDLRKTPRRNFNLHSTSTPSRMSELLPKPRLYPSRTLFGYPSFKITDEQIMEAMPENASSIFHVVDRRINFDAHPADASFYSLLRSWVQDDPYRKIPPNGSNLLEYVDLPSGRRVSNDDLDTTSAADSAAESPACEKKVETSDTLGKIQNQVDVSMHSLRASLIAGGMRAKQQKLKGQREKDAIGMERLKSLGITFPPRKRLKS